MIDLWKEENPSYSARLRDSAMRMLYGKTGSIACYDCGLAEEPELLEIHHIYSDGEMSGNDWRRIHGKGGAELYRYILKPGVNKPDLALLCPTCHARRHNRAHKHD